MKIYLSLVISLLFLSLGNIISAQEDIIANPSDPGVLPNGDLAPDYRQQYPSSGSTLVILPNSGRSLMCEAIVYNRWLSLLSTGGIFSYAESNVRSDADPAYPCDIDRIGVRTRIWVNGGLKADSAMAYYYNSADAVTFSTASGHYSCNDSSINILSRGNHEFKAGATDVSYVTEATDC